MFFITDDWRDFFTEEAATQGELFIKLGVGFLFFGIPTIMLLIKRHVEIHTNDRIEIWQPLIRRKRVYYFKDLIWWRAFEYYAQQGGNQKTLIIKFKSKKLSFNGLELAAYHNIVSYLEKEHSDQFKMQKTLFDRWFPKSAKTDT